MGWIVVEGNELIYPGERSEFKSLFKRAVTPPDVKRVLLFAVLRVVNEKIHAGGKVVAGSPFLARGKLG